MAAFKEDVTNYSNKTTIAQCLMFKENDKHWFYLSIEPNSTPLSRNFFKGECKGSRILQ
jgi:hypothetical protein